MGKGPSGSEKKTERGYATSQAGLGRTAGTEAEMLFGESNPAFAQALDYFRSLASGDPNKLQAAIAPAVQQTSYQTEQAISNIKNTMPRGGEKNLAMEQARLQQAGEVSSLATGAYTQAQNALAQLGMGGMGLSQNELLAALQGYSGAAGTLGNVMQMEEEGKASTMGLFSSLAEAGGLVAAAAI